MTTKTPAKNVQINIQLTEADPLAEKFEALRGRIPATKNATLARLLLAERMDLLDAGYDVGDEDMKAQIVEAIGVLSK